MLEHPRSLQGTSLLTTGKKAPPVSRRWYGVAGGTPSVAHPGPGRDIKNGTVREGAVGRFRGTAQCVWEGTCTSS
jgi:hypothetical protein